MEGGAHVRDGPRASRDRGVTMLVRVDVAGGAGGVLLVSLSHQAAGFAPYRLDNCSCETLHLRRAPRVCSHRTYGLLASHARRCVAAWACPHLVRAVQRAGRPTALPAGHARRLPLHATQRMQLPAGLPAGRLPACPPARWACRHATAPANAAMDR